MEKPLFGSALVSVFSGWYELLGLISTVLLGLVLFFRRSARSFAEQLVVIEPNPFPVRREQDFCLIPRSSGHEHNKII